MLDASIREEASRLVEANYQFFQKHLQELKDHWATQGKFILIGIQKFEGAYDTFENAFSAGVGRFGPGKFSVQEVTLEICYEAITA